MRKIRRCNADDPLVGLASNDPADLSAQKLGLCAGWDDNRHNLRVGKQILYKRHLHLNAVLGQVRGWVGLGCSLCDDCLGQRLIDINQTQRTLPRARVIDRRGGSMISMPRPEDDKGVNVAVGLLYRAKDHPGKITAEYPAGVRYYAGDDLCGQSGRFGWDRLDRAGGEVLFDLCQALLPDTRIKLPRNRCFSDGHIVSPMLIALSTVALYGPCNRIPVLLSSVRHNVNLKLLFVTGKTDGIYKEDFASGGRYGFGQ